MGALAFLKGLYHSIARDIRLKLLSRGSCRQAPLLCGAIIAALSALAPACLAQSSESSQLAITSLAPSRYPGIPGSPLGFAAKTAGGTGTVTFSFDFGDGTPETPFGALASVTHTYATQGRYFVRAVAEDSSGSLASKDIIVTVTNLPRQSGALSSSSIVQDPKNRDIWAVNPDNDSVSRLTPAKIMTEFPLQSGCHPRTLAIDGTNNVWVTCSGDDTVVVLGNDGKVKRRLGAGYGSAPFGIVPSPDRSLMYVTLAGRGFVLSISTSSFRAVSALRLGPSLRALAITADGSRLLVTRFISADNFGLVWDVASNGGALKLTRAIPLIEDTVSTEPENLGRGVPNYLAGITIDPSGRKAWVVGKKDNTRRGPLAATQDLDTAHTVRASVFEIDLVAGREDFFSRKDIDNSDSPSAVAFSPLGDYAFVVTQGNNLISVFDRFRAVNTTQQMVPKPPTGRFFTELAPQGVVVDARSGKVYVQNFMSRSISIFDFRNYLLGLDTVVPSESLRTVAASSEKLSAQVLLGKQIFYNASDNRGVIGRNRMSAEGYISCATCHVDGGHDGRTFDFTGRGEGLRNTTDLRGRRGTGHGRVHWSANFDEIQDFENDIRNAFGGKGFMSDADFQRTKDTIGVPKAAISAELDALSAYLASLDNSFYPRSPFRNLDGSMTAAGVAGKAVFTKLQCESCHAGADFTDSSLSANSLHNVGTITTASGKRLNGALPGIDTPTLRGIWDTAPYLHTGEARTLAEVFSCVGGIQLQAESAAGVGAIDRARFSGARGGGAALLANGAAALQFASIDGGRGGKGLMRVRYSAKSDGVLTVAVNGLGSTLRALRSANVAPGIEFNSWNLAAPLEVALVAGVNNTVSIQWAGAGSLAIDEILISRADDVAAAEPHRRVLALPAAEQTSLIRFLVELDGRDPGASVVAPMDATTRRLLRLGRSRRPSRK